MWMGGAPDWSAIAVALGAGPGGIGPGAGNVTAALEPSRRQLENWRSRLNDLWNIAGGWGEGEAASSSSCCSACRRLCWLLQASQRPTRWTGARRRTCWANRSARRTTALR